MAKVSIVIPVYNVEMYLRECLDSVRNQTLMNLEIICVDDGSTDFSGRILDEYAKKDERFRVVHKQNEGYGKAMNVGMSMATSPYVGIVESDDFIDENMYEKLSAIMEEKHPDFIKTDYHEFYESGDGGYIEQYMPLIAAERYQGLYETIFNTRDHDEVFSFPKYIWTGLYNREFLEREHIVFNETPGASYQDKGFWFQTFIKAKSIYFAPQAFYYYRVDNPNASMSSKGKVFATCDEYDFVRGILDGMGEAGKSFYRCECYVRMKDCIYHVNRVAEEHREALLQRIKEDFLLAAHRGEVDSALYNNYLREQIFEIIADPRAYLKKEKARRKKIENVVLNYDTVILYGAGKIGQSAQRVLREGRVNTKIKYFAVTEPGHDPAMVAGIPVKAIDDLQDYKESALVVVAVGKKFVQEVETILKARGFRNYIRFDDML